MSQKIKDALAKLDRSNDNHWTSDGLPRLEVVKELAGYTNQPSRETITATLPGFTRASAGEVAAQEFRDSDTDVEDTLPAVRVAAVSDAPSEELYSELVRSQVKLAELGAARDAAVRAYDAANATNDKLIAAVEAARPNSGNADAVQGYLAQQRANLDEQARRIRAMKGIDLKALLPKKAPIDAQRARKSRYV